MFSDVIFDRTFGDHLKNIESVLRRLHGVNLKTFKVCFFPKVNSLLRHIISHDVVATDPSKTQKIAGWPTTKNVQELRFSQLL